MNLIIIKKHNCGYRHLVKQLLCVSFKLFCKVLQTYTQLIKRRTKFAFLSLIYCLIGANTELYSEFYLEANFVITL